MTIQQRNERYWEQRNKELGQLSDEIVSLMEYYDIYDLEIDVVLNLVKDSYGSFNETIETDSENEDLEDDLEED